MVCPKCQSESISLLAAEIRLYCNRMRSISHPPMNPPPDVRVCLDCGWREFSIPDAWMSAGWLRQVRQEPVGSGIAS